VNVIIRKEYLVAIEAKYLCFIPQKEALKENWLFVKKLQIFPYISA
jgi:hypothetical protein